MIGKTICSVAALSILFLGGCDHRFSPELLVAPAGSDLPMTSSNVKVHWNGTEFLYINACWYNSGPLAYAINSDGTLVPPLTRYDIDNNAPPVPGQYETYIAGLTASPDHRSIYFARLESDEPLNRVEYYRIGREVNSKIKQVFTEGDNSYSLASIAFIGRGHFLYVMYNQIKASLPIPNRKILVAYRLGIDGRVKRLPGPPVVAATYATAAMVANPLIVVAYAITGPSTHFLYVVRPEDHCLDVYRIKASGSLMAPPAASLALGYRAGKSVFLPNGRILFVADADHACIKQYQIGPNGVPMLLLRTVPGVDPVLDPRGRFLYAAAPGNHSLLCYNILPDGTLRQAGATATHDLCFMPCVDATGRFVYAMARNLDRHELAISQFRITVNGTLVPLQPEEVPAVASTTLITAQ